MEILRLYALGFVGKEFVPGKGRTGPGHLASHFVQELMAGIGACPAGHVVDSQDLYDAFEQNSCWKVYEVGSLAFYGKSALEIEHVGMLVDPYRLVEAPAGRGIVRMRPVNYREDLVAVMKPRFHLLGVPR